MVATRGFHLQEVPNIWIWYFVKLFTEERWLLMRSGCNHHQCKINAYGGVLLICEASCAQIVQDKIGQRRLKSLEIKEIDTVLYSVN